MALHLRHLPVSTCVLAAVAAVSAVDCAHVHITEEAFVATPVNGHVHASTILSLDDEGEYLAAWFEGTKESAKDVAIRGTRRIHGTWEPVRTFAKINPKQPDGRTTEFSYPTVIEPRPGILALTFTWNRRQIRFVEIKLPHLQKF